MHAAAAPSSNQPFFLELQRTMYNKTQKTTTTTTMTCSSSCSATNVEFLLQSFSTAPELQKRHLTSFKEKTKKKAILFLPLSLYLSLSLSSDASGTSQTRRE